jgi:hypothetical protein
VDTIDLRYASAVELSQKSTFGFKVKTNSARYRFQADTRTTQLEWKKAVEAATFKAKNDGNSVKVGDSGTFILYWQKLNDMPSGGLALCEYDGDQFGSLVQIC